jgi:hypothetical protein
MGSGDPGLHGGGRDDATSARLGRASWHGVLRRLGHGRGASVEFPLCWRMALLPQMVCPRGRRHGRYVVVVPLHACSLMLGSIVPGVIDVRCGAVPPVGLLYSLCCSVVVPFLLLA